MSQHGKIIFYVQKNAKNYVKMMFNTKVHKNVKLFYIIWQQLSDLHECSSLIFKLCFRCEKEIAALKKQQEEAEKAMKLGNHIHF